MDAAVKIDAEDLNRVVDVALAEDLRYGPDATTLATVDVHQIATARITPRQGGVLAGLPAAVAVFEKVVPGLDIRHAAADGTRLEIGVPVLEVTGPVGALLTAERTALNLLCHLSGIATATARWVEQLDGTGCTVRDSRKTLPGLRLLQKYAVRAGGGANHRFGLGDAILIKDNHVAAAGSVTAAIRAAKAHAPHLHLEVEVDTLDQLEEAFAEQATEILLDNFTPQDCAKAVARRAELGSPAKLEASGGLRIDNATEYAATGVDYLAVGGLTHSVIAVDLGMDL
jgi:nicotinate-nucleotide pyrophosphorylase (carboxylating)